MPLKPRIRITNGIARNLTRIERARGFPDTATLSGDWTAGMNCRKAFDLAGVHRRSLQRDPRGLIEKGLLDAEGATNRLLYRASGRL